MTSQLSRQALPGAAPPPKPSEHRQLLWSGLTALLVLSIHFPTFKAMAQVWLRSQTFAHGIVVLPICGWLAWRRRARLAALDCRPAYAAQLLLAGLGAIWLLAQLANVPVVQQASLIAMVPASIGAVLGLAHVRALAFPLAYLFLAVPFGEVFVPPLMEFTARFTVGALQFSGIPVYRENNDFSLPSGSWSVIEACSGLRYLIASLALGMLYADLNYRSPLRRLAFVLVSLLLPIVGNGMRAYLIVMLGHWSDMRLAAGIDHLIYGWLFFGLLSLLLFCCGAYWREAPAPPGLAAALPATRSGKAGAQGRAFPLTAIVLAVWPAWAALLPQTPDAATEPASLLLAMAPAPWRAVPWRDVDWSAPHQGHPQRYAARYQRGGASLTLQLYWYAHQEKDGELLSAVERFAGPGTPDWREVQVRQRSVDVGGRSLAVRQTLLQAAGNKLLVWRWYRQSGVDSANPLLVKLLLARSKLVGGDDGGAEVVLACAYDEQAEPAEATLRSFLGDMLPAIEEGLHRAVHR